MDIFCDIKVGHRLSLEPLSAALVTADGREFYGEVEPVDSKVGLDAFAREAIVPLFGRVANAAAQDLDEFAARLGDFIGQLGGGHRLVYEHEGTWICLERVAARRTAAKSVLQGWERLEASAELEGPFFEMAATRSYTADVFQLLKPNHALADARALRARWLAREPESPSLQAASSSKRLARDFLSNLGPDHRGRMLSQVLAWGDSQLASTPDYIQWLFPLTAHSPFNPLAPAPTLEEFAELAQDLAVRAGVGLAAMRMLKFYGLHYDGSRVIKAANWPERSAVWIAWSTTHDRYISRMLRSISLLGLRPEAKLVLQTLEALIPEYRPSSSARALGFWRAAVAE